MEVDEGSHVLRVTLATGLFASVEPDLQLLGRQDVLGELDVRRAGVIQKWQARAKNEAELLYEIRPDDERLPKIRINRLKGQEWPSNVLVEPIPGV